MPEKRTISAKEIAADINAGMTDEAISAKYRLSADVLKSLKGKLREKGLISETTSDLRLAVTPSVAITDKRALARAIADTVKAGASDRRIIERFHIAAVKLPNVYATLIRAGFLTQDDIDRRTESTDGDATPSGPQPTLTRSLITAPSPEKQPAEEDRQPAPTAAADEAEGAPEPDAAPAPPDPTGKNEPEPATSAEPEPSPATPDELTFNWVCPACGTLQTQEHEVCPKCGAVAAEHNAMIPAVENPAGPNFVGERKPARNDDTRVLPLDALYGDSGSDSGPRGVEALIRNRYEFDGMRYMREGYRIFKQAAGVFVGFTFLFVALSALTGGLLNLFLGLVLAGYFTVSFKIMRNEPVEFGDFFKGFSHFWPLFLSGLLVDVLTVVGFMLCLIPGMYLSIAYGLVVPLILTKKLGAWESMEASRKIVTSGLLSFAWLYFLVFAINLGGLLLCGIGLLASIPIGWCAIAAAYSDLVGLEEEDAPARL
jgi:hypothetical protein